MREENKLSDGPEALMEWIGELMDGHLMTVLEDYLMVVEIVRGGHLVIRLGEWGNCIKGSIDGHLMTGLGPLGFCLLGHYLISIQ